MGWGLRPHSCIHHHQVVCCTERRDTGLHKPTLLKSLQDEVESGKKLQALSPDLSEYYLVFGSLYLPLSSILPSLSPL